MCQTINLGMFLSAFCSWHNVAWLYDCVLPRNIDDKDDLWVKTWGRQLPTNHHGNHDEKTILQNSKTDIKLSSTRAKILLTSPAIVLQYIASILSTIVFVTVYLSSTGVTGGYRTMFSYIKCYIKYALVLSIRCSKY